jgi:hypothetical protein
VHVAKVRRWLWQVFRHPLTPYYAIDAWNREGTVTLVAASRNRDPDDSGMLVFFRKRS